MLRFACLALIVCACASEVRVDQPDRWADPGASHHGKHAVAGFIIGAAAFDLASLATDARAPRYVLSIGTAALVGAGYEIARGLDGSAYMDPVDVGWCVAGAVVGAALSDATGGALSLAMHRGGAGLVVAYRF